MKNFIKLFLLVTVFSVATTSCEGDEGFFGDEIFNDETRAPYVSIQDLNEEIVFGGNGNNFWSFQLTAENDGNQVRIVYDSQDNNIQSHQVYVGTDSNDSTGPLESDVLLSTINTFPTELVFTKEDIATALNVPLSDLDSGSVYFRGRSSDTDGNTFEDPSLLEAFLAFERHAYFYEWELDQ